MFIILVNVCVALSLGILLLRGEIGGSRLLLVALVTFPIANLAAWFGLRLREKN